MTSANPGPKVDLDVGLYWMGEPIAVRALRRDGRAGAGDAPESLGPIPCEALGSAGVTFARLDAGAARACVPEGAMATLWRADGRCELVEGPAEPALSEGDRAELAVGAFVLRATASRADTDPSPRARRSRNGRALAFTGVAAAMHLVVLGLSAQAAAARAPEEREDEQADAFQEMLVRAEHRARARDPIAGGDNGDAQGAAVNQRPGDGRAGGGPRAARDQGAMGDRDSRAAKGGRYAVPTQSKKDPERSLAREEALRDAQSFGMIGLVPQSQDAPSSAWLGGDEAHGADPIAATGNMWAFSIGSSFGAGGLGLTGIGEGGGGTGEGVGLGGLGALGHTLGLPGDGTGGRGEGSRASGVGWSSRLTGHRARAPSVRYCMCGLHVSGRLPPETIQRIVRQNFGRFRACYQDGLRRNPSLAGRVAVNFVIGRDGAVSQASDTGSDLPDGAVRSCVVRAFYGLSFPQPEGGIVTVTYPIVLTPET